MPASNSSAMPLSSLGGTRSIGKLLDRLGATATLEAAQRQLAHVLEPVLRRSRSISCSIRALVFEVVLAGEVDRRLAPDDVDDRSRWTCREAPAR